MSARVCGTYDPHRGEVLPREFELVKMGKCTFMHAPAPPREPSRKIAPKTVRVGDLDWAGVEIGQKRAFPAPKGLSRTCVEQLFHSMVGVLPNSADSTWCESTAGQPYLLAIRPECPVPAGRGSRPQPDGAIPPRSLSAVGHVERAWRARINGGRSQRGSQPGARAALPGHRSLVTAGGFQR
jgi:hypothetical protein